MSQPVNESEAPNPVIPFGKYRGKHAGDVSDVRYLDWMLGLDLREPFKSEFEAHLESRQDWQDFNP